MKKHKQIFISVLGVSMLALVVSDTRCNTSNATHHFSYGGTFRIGTYLPLQDIHPLYNNYSESYVICGLVFSQLFRLDKDTKPVPDIVASWDRSEDALIYTLYLRRDIRFHDGVSLTADDVVYTYDALLNPASASPQASVRLIIERVEKVNQWTVRLYLKKAEKNVLIHLTCGILPSHVLRNSSLMDATFLAHPIGSGPFMYETKRDDGTIVLRAYKQYYKQRPYLDTIEFKPISEREITTTALFREDIDMVNFITYHQYQDVARSDEYRGIAVPGDYYYAVAYDLSDEALRHESVRYAFAHGISQSALIHDVFEDQALSCTGPFYPASEGHNPDVVPFSYDVAKAEALLEKNGYQKEGGSLYRKKKSKELELRMLVNTRFPHAQDIVKNLMVQYARLGVRVRPVVVDNIEAELKKKMSDRKDRANCFLGLFLGGGDLQNAAYYWYSKADIYPRIYPYAFPVVDELLQKIESGALSEQRPSFYQRIHAELYQEQPVLFLAYPYQFHAVHKRMRNVEEYCSVGMPVDSLTTIAINDET